MQSPGLQLSLRVRQAMSDFRKNKSTKQPRGTVMTG